MLHRITTTNKEITMSTKEVIETLKQYSKWRNGADVEMPNPKSLTEAINESIKLLEEYEDRKGK